MGFYLKQIQVGFILGGSMKVLALLAFFLVGANQVEAAQRLPIADYMTCTQAINYYQKHKRIYVIANGKDVVPIYGHKPISEWRGLVCRGRGKVRRSYWVDTLDSKQCVIGVYCQ
jgi:hypothetical protein